MSKYNASGSQASYQTGSNDQVLSNRLGIISPDEMDDAELAVAFAGGCDGGASRF